MVAFARVLAAGAALVCAFVAGPAAALTLTFQIHVTGSNPGDPPIDDFQMTWTFDPVFYDTPTGPVLFGEVVGLIDTPQSADLLAAGGFEDPLPTPNTSWGLVRTTAGNTLAQLSQRLSQGDEVTERFSEYETFIESGGIVPAIAPTPGGFVYALQTLGDLMWTQRATHWVGGYHVDGPPREYVDGRLYTGTAHLIAWDVPPENLAVPEPGTWALMILGFGLSGAALRRRKLLAPVA